MSIFLKLLKYSGESGLGSGKLTAAALMRHDALQGDVDVVAMDQETLFINALLRTLVSPYIQMLTGFMLNICDHNDQI